MTWRIFCALDIPGGIRQRIREHVQSLVRSNPDIKASWTNPDSIHLTLKFIGNIGLDRIPLLSEAAAVAANGCQAFDLRIGSCGVFPSRSRAKVLWIGVNDPTGELTRLQQRLELECDKRDFLKEERSFKPHLTIARLRSGGDTKKLVQDHLATQFPEQNIGVEELIVFRSELSSDGSIYSAISKHQLSGHREKPIWIPR